MIPKTFRLLAHEWRVVVIPEPFWKHRDEWGSTDHALCLIEILEGHPSVMEHTFYHELTHAILALMGQDKLGADEAFVDLLGGLIQQAISTAEE